MRNVSSSQYNPYTTLNANNFSTVGLDESAHELPDLSKEIPGMVMGRFVFNDGSEQEIFAVIDTRYLTYPTKFPNLGEQLGFDMTQGRFQDIIHCGVRDTVLIYSNANKTISQINNIMYK